MMRQSAAARTGGGGPPKYRGVAPQLRSLAEIDRMRIDGFAALGVASSTVMNRGQSSFATSSLQSMAAEAKGGAGSATGLIVHDLARRSAAAMAALADYEEGDNAPRAPHAPLAAAPPLRSHSLASHRSA